MNIILWGTGKAASVLMENLNCNIVVVVDNDERKWGKEWNGFTIQEPAVLKNTEIEYDKIIIAVADWKVIKRQLTEKMHVSSDKIDNMFFRQRENLLQYFCKHPEDLDDEKKAHIEYIKKNPLDVFNAPFSDKYVNLKPEVFLDPLNGMYYVNYKQKRMYFSREYGTKEKAERYYRALLMEQDKKSPHCYQTGTFCVKRGDVVLDAGVAEGNFALDVIEKVSKIYLIEMDTGWIEALEYTFLPWKEKVEIIQEELGFGAGRITIDEVIGDGKLDFLKMDIEGGEASALKGAQYTLKKNESRVVICTYHRPEDYRLITDELSRYGYTCKSTEGYMTFINLTNFMETEYPQFVKGVVRGEKV